MNSCCIIVESDMKFQRGFYLMILVTQINGIATDADSICFDADRSQVSVTVCQYDNSGFDEINQKLEALQSKFSFLIYENHKSTINI